MVFNALCLRNVVFTESKQQHSVSFFELDRWSGYVAELSVPGFDQRPTGGFQNLDFGRKFTGLRH